jgi:arylsulfatase A-like enzyme
MRLKIGLVLCTAALVAAGCSEPSPSGPLAQHLVDVFSPKLVSHSQTARPSGPGAGRPSFLWRFDQPTDAANWVAVAGVSALAVRNGHLEGTATTPAPILRLTSIPGVDPGDMLYAVEVRMRVSGGQAFGVHFMGEKLEQIDEVLLSGAPIPWPNQASITAAEGMTTFTLRPDFPVYGSGMHELLLRPTDAPGARFEIESVHLIFRREHLASVPSGVGWLGMNETYRETVVARSPESIHWPVTLPDRPRLTLALATLDERPVTFRVGLEAGEGQPVEVLARTLTTPHQWEEAAVDLDEWHGRKVTLALTLDAAEPGTLGVWAAPVVRRRQSTQQAGDRPQAVILVMTDTLRPDRLDAYGNTRKTAPAVASLAKGGALFRDAHAQATWTKVSAPVLLTSLFPLTSGVRDFPDRMPSAATTIAEAYRKAGYATLGYSSAPFTGSFSNMHQGYELLRESPITLISSKTARTLTDLFLPWLETHRDEPFFVYLHYFDPHAPYRPDAPFDRLWGEPTWADEQARNSEKVAAAIQDEDRRMENMMNPSDFRAAGVDLATYVQHDLTWYDGSIREMDTELERILERLHELGIDDRTLVVFTSDHGEEFFEHNWSGHGQTTYGELTRVPLIVSYPGVVPAGKVLDETVGLIDVMPTMLDLSGLPIPERAEGQSLAPLLRAKAVAAEWKPRPVFVDRPAAPHFVSPYPRDQESFAVIHEGWKLIWNTKRPAGAPEYELYDHRRDPGDHHDVAAEHPDVVQRLARVVAGWRKDAERRRLPSDKEAGRGLSPEERDRLRALGYIH